MINWGFFQSGTSLLWIFEESAWESLWLWLLALVTGWRWHVTCDIWNVIFDMWQVTCHMWHITCDSWQVTHYLFKQKVPKSTRKIQKEPKNAKRLKVPKTECRKVVKKQDFILLVLLSAHAFRVVVFRNQDLEKIYIY